MIVSRDGLGCNSCEGNIPKSYEEGLEGILGDLGAGVDCGPMVSAADYGPPYPLAGAANEAYLAARSAQLNCLNANQGVPVCSPGSTFQGGRVGNDPWYGSCVSLATSQPIAAPPVQTNQCGPGLQWDTRLGRCASTAEVMALNSPAANQAPTAASVAAKLASDAAAIAANAALDIANKRAKALKECPVGYSWDGNIDSVTTGLFGLRGLGGCIKIAAPPVVVVPTSANQTNQQANATTGTTAVVPASAPIASGIPSSWFLYGGLALVGLMLLSGKGE